MPMTTKERKFMDALKAFRNATDELAQTMHELRDPLWLEYGYPFEHPMDQIAGAIQDWFVKETVRRTEPHTLERAAMIGTWGYPA